MLIWRVAFRSFVDIKFGENKNEQLYEHMKRPQVGRLVTPGAPDALSGDDLRHLRMLEGPKKTPGRARSKKSEGNARMLPAEAVLAYWSKDSDAAAKARSLQSSLLWPEASRGSAVAEEEGQRTDEGQPTLLRRNLLASLPWYGPDPLPEKGESLREENGKEPADSKL